MNGTCFFCINRHKLKIFELETEDENNLEELQQKIQERLRETEGQNTESIKKLKLVIEEMKLTDNTPEEANYLDHTGTKIDKLQADILNQQDKNVLDELRIKNLEQVNATLEEANDGLMKFLSERPLLEKNFKTEIESIRD